jgi:hypothetical protein
VIHDVDVSLRTLLRRCLPEHAEVEFAPPRAEPHVRAMLLSGFLHDIREDVSGLAGYSDDIRAIDGTVTGRRQPIRRYRLRYLLTAWTGEHADLTEHQLLDAVLFGCVEHQSIPADCLAGPLADAGQPVTLRCAPADETPVSADAWARLGVPPRTTLDLVVIAPLLPTVHTELAEPPAEFDLRPAQRGRPEAPPQSAGRVPRGRITEPS